MDTVRIEEHELNGVYWSYIADIETSKDYTVNYIEGYTDIDKVELSDITGLDCNNKEYTADQHIINELREYAVKQL